MCIPLDAIFTSRIGKGLELKSLTRLSRDLSNSWLIFIVCACVSFVVGGLFIIALKHRARCVIWLFIIMFFILLIAISIVSGLAYKTTRQTGSLLMCIVFSLLAALLMILTICHLRRIRLVIAIMKTCSIFIADNMSSLLLPILDILLSFLVLFTYLLSVINLYSIGHLEHYPKTLPFAAFHHTSYIWLLIITGILGLYWLLALLVGALQFIIVSATALWYF
jgi:hypothetical protein